MPTLLKTEIICIVDRSGSMGSMRADAINGFNTFINDQKKEPGEARVTYCQFDTFYETVYSAKPLQEVPLLDEKTFVPRGGTALNDAVGRTLNTQGERIKTDNWAEKVIVVVLTDGGENASREFNSDQIKAMTKHAQENGWAFVYLGANQDSFQTAVSLGIDTKSTNNMVANFAATGAGMTQAYSNISASTTSLRSGGSAS